MNLKYGKGSNNSLDKTMHLLGEKENENFAGSQKFACGGVAKIRLKEATKSGAPKTKK